MVESPIEGPLNLGPGYDLTTDEQADLRRRVEEAEHDFAEERVHIRWGKAQLDLVKRAAVKAGEEIGHESG